MTRADSHDLIRVRVRARANTPKDVSIEIPKRRLTVFTGVSGSGKSSLVFGTIAAESQRLADPTENRAHHEPGGCHCQSPQPVPETRS